ncbi:hypothetical protein AV540_20140 [Brevibacillus parabrevis]|uniref:LysR substrate-binding domain-containing protein n=1 Tax=Brevibacillus parabrevis TaxID=54914 RepID=UPI0007AB6F7C|nr:LysR substrate-binding domain-containing protein [Brevibacillus parabrevis]KZE47114.1 hypothetical protein AV540_20140 [Brevibacillus parabrevis]
MWSRKPIRKEMLKLEGVIPRKVMEFGTYETINGGVTAGIGMTILPKSAVRQLAESGQIHMHPVPKPYRDVTTMFIRRKRCGHDQHDAIVFG